MSLYYFESDRGCGIREAKTQDRALASLQREVGWNNVSLVRRATPNDLAWVRGMGGHVPEHRAGSDTGSRE